MDSLKAQLLVATPMLGDPNFDRAVVWLLEHGEDGALGVVLNRPSDLLVSEPLPSWDQLTGELPVVFRGGPVSTQSVIGVARVRTGTPEGAWAPVMGEIEQGAWFVVQADPGDPFTARPEDLWRSVLARQGPELARFALVPDDPSVN